MTCTSVYQALREYIMLSRQLVSFLLFSFLSYFLYFPFFLCGIFECENKWVHDSCAFSWNLFLLLLLSNYEVYLILSDYILFYYILLYFITIPFKSACFLIKERAWVWGKMGRNLNFKKSYKVYNSKETAHIGCVAISHYYIFVY